MKKDDEIASAFHPLQEILTEFAPIPSLIGKVAPEDRAYETLQMRQGEAYNLLEQLIAEISIVYTPPKVAGQTIAATLWAHPTIPKPKHIHFLSSKGLAFIDWLIEQSQSHPNVHLWQTLMAHGRWVRVMLAANRMLHHQWDGIDRAQADCDQRRPGTDGPVSVVGVSGVVDACGHSRRLDRGVDPCPDEERSLASPV